MKRFLAFAALVTAAGYAKTPDAADPRVAAHAFDVALQTGNKAALEQMIAPDFVFVRGSGRVGGKRDFIEAFTSPDQTMEPFRIEHPLLIRASADVAIIGGESWIRGVEGGKPFEEHFRYSDIFARRRGRWVAVYTQVTGLP